MKEIMKIFDIHTIPNRGVVIGGTNTALDTLSLEKLKSQVGKLIKIKTKKDAIAVKVVDVGVTTALTGKKNIFILLPLDFKIPNFYKGSIVYT